MVNGPEECDATDLAGQSCESQGFTGGDLVCSSDCTFDTSGCYNMEVDCSDGLDDDGDGLTDCADGDCDGVPECDGVCVVDGGQVGCGWYDTADLAQDGHDRVDAWVGPGCPVAEDYSGAEMVYWGTNSSQDPAQVDVRVWGMSQNLDVLILHDDGTGCVSSLSCVSVSDNPELDMEHVRFRADPGQTYYLVVDGFHGAVSDFQVAVNCLEEDALAVFEEFSGFNDNFDLDGVAIGLTPDANEPNGYRWASAGGVSALPVTPGSGQISQPLFQGTTVPAFEEVVLAQPVTFYGQTYDRIYVSSAGWVTFGAPDNRLGSSTQSLFSGPPRIAGHWMAMDPTQGGEVYVDEMADGSVAVSFVEVPNRFGPVTGVNTFQIVIAASGEISIVTLSHTGRGIVGISAGYGIEGPDEVNFH